MEKDEDNGGRGYSAGLGIRTFCGAWFHWESQITNAKINSGQQERQGPKRLVKELP